MPFRTEHAARQHAPSRYRSCGRVTVYSHGRPIGLLTCSPTGRQTAHDTEVASIRFPVDYWSVTTALAWLRKHGYRTDKFEEATE